MFWFCVLDFDYLPLLLVSHECCFVLCGCAIDCFEERAGLYTWGNYRQFLMSNSAVEFNDFLIQSYEYSLCPGGAVPVLNSSVGLFILTN